MGRITESDLFLALAPKIKSITKKQLAKELARVKRVPECDWDDENKNLLILAFYWSASPQGHDFWDKIYRESRQ